MADTLTSVGLDVGTTTTQLIVSKITLENRASAFAVPDMEITDRQVVYRSPVYFTPLIRDQLVDGDAIRHLVEREYTNAGLRRQDVDTGAVIITGETSRKENAAAVLESLSDYAGDFVVATAGPDLESVLAARGAGAVAYSEETGETVLHFDIGGGTSNWALIRAGEIEATGCLNVGGRLLKLDETGRVIYVSPVVKKLCKLKIGDMTTQSQVEDLAEVLTQALEMAAGLRPVTELLEQLTTKEANQTLSLETCPQSGVAIPWRKDDSAVISFSGGVADCIGRDYPWLEFGDMGPVLGRAIRRSRLCRGRYRLGSETIRATVIGAGCHSAQLSGSTVYYRNVDLPLKNLPVVTDLSALERLDSPGVLALGEKETPGYDRIRTLAGTLAESLTGPVYLVAEADMAKALGHALALRLPPDRPILCLDRLRLRPGDYLDVGKPTGPAIPVVVKTLILQR